MSQAASPVEIVSKPAAEKAVMGILWALSLSHLLNDTIQSLIPAIYPVLKESYGFSYAEIGLITFAFQMTGRFCSPWWACAQTAGRSLTHWRLAWVSRLPGCSSSRARKPCP